jgi:hypothetical protein
MAHLRRAKQRAPHRAGGRRRGRDAIEVALITSFGPLSLTAFEVRTERILAPTAL